MFYIHGKSQKLLRSFKIGEVIFFLCRPWTILSRTFTNIGVSIALLSSGSDEIYLSDSTRVYTAEACYADEPDLPF